MTDRLKEIAGRIAIAGKVVTDRPPGQGFINDTYLVVQEGESESRYIL